MLEFKSGMINSIKSLHNNVSYIPNKIFRTKGCDYFMINTTCEEDLHFLLITSGCVKIILFSECLQILLDFLLFS